MWNNTDDRLLQDAYNHTERPTEEPKKIWLLISDKKNIDWSTETPEELIDMKPTLDAGEYQIGWIWEGDYDQRDFATTYRLFNPTDVFKINE